MLKVTILASLFAGIAMSANVAAATTVKPVAKRDAEIIVEVNRDVESLTEEGVKNTQQVVLNNIRNYVTTNFKVITSYTAVVNAFAISVNSNYIELIKKVPGVKSVTLNELHWETTTESYSSSRGTPVEDEYGGSDNISAQTMKMSDDTNEGEGTLVAILDNEFFFRGTHIEDGVTKTWNHETFSDLDSSVSVRYEGHPTDWQKTYAYKQSSARGDLLADDADLGKEGSLYFNRKVPFYYDYGGERSDYSEKYKDDLDVSSELTYHGSHVASITAGNAPTYKGIAPKAQLICMKVFTNFNPSPIGKLLGYSNSSGAYDIPIMNALDDCIKLNVDIINMSLGSNLNDFDSDTITVKTLHKLASKGILASISAGNSGKTSYATTGGYANWTSEMVETGILSGYSNDSLVTTVASGQPTKVFYEAAFQLGDQIVAYDDQIVNREYYGDEYEKEFPLAKTLEEKYPSYAGVYPWVYVPGFGTSADYNNADSVEGKIAVVNRGSTSFADKYAVAKSKGAIALVVINNDPTSNDFNFRMSFGDDFRPSMPCVIVLYKDKSIFSTAKSGNLNIISKRLLDNDKAYSVSTFSSDGATFDLDLKPEITAPGDFIKGAVPPQKTEDRTEERRYKVYEFLSGTSMSSPNHAGAQSVLLSKYAKQYTADIEAIKNDSSKTDSQKQTALNNLAVEYAAKRATVDMRLQSTAEPMYDLKESPESGEITLTSPRRQGAGMVDLGDAYHTDVYLEGYDLNGNKTGKGKIALRNSADINNGIVNLKFLAHNEDTVAHTYSAKLTIMRPAIANANEIVTKEYNFKGDIDAISGFPGHVYYIPNSVEGGEPTRNESFGVAEVNDVYNVTRDIEYYASAEDCKAGIKTTIYKNRYYNAGTVEYPDWQVMPGKDYQSVQDVVIAKVDLADVVVPVGDTNIQLAKYTLTDSQKADIENFFDYGCYLEGYVSLEDKDGESANLSIPFMGFYGGADKDYGDAPVYEPFSFEKDSSKVYPSDLVNDIAKTLIGKDKADMGSMWVAGYVKEGQGVNTNSILSNDDNFANLTGFHKLGIDPNTEEYYDDPSNNLYVGSSYFTNTMIVQQFILRSVRENYFSIVNNDTGATVYRSALEDMLFGDDDFGRYALYKSHIDDTFLGAGYVSHRAYAVIPLYDAQGKPFASGDYTITFNYLLAGTGEWVSYDYTLHIDSDAPIVESLTESGDNIHINIKERNLVSLSVDKDLVDIFAEGSGLVKVDDEHCYFEISKQKIEDYLLARMNYYQGSGRLILRLKDAAYGTMGVIIRFEYDENDEIKWNKYVMVEHHELTLQHDFEDDGVNVEIVKYNSSTSTETPVGKLEGYTLISRGPVKDTIKTVVSGCSGNVTSSSIILSTLALITLAGVVISSIRRKKVLGGND